MDSTLQEKEFVQKKLEWVVLSFFPVRTQESSKGHAGSATQCGRTEAIQPCRPEEGECPPIRWTPFPPQSLCL